jgi:hypothetical protein
VGQGLTDAAGRPVARSVVRLEVHDPAGRLVRHYSGNVTVVDGRARWEIPRALNDAAGGWRLEAWRPETWSAASGLI